MSHLAYKFRLYPTATQERALLQQLETLRRLFNECLGFCKDSYKAAKESGQPSQSTMSQIGDFLKSVSERRNRQIASDDLPKWLANLPISAIRGATDRVQKAYDGFFRRLCQKRSKLGFPRFKSRGKVNSIHFKESKGWGLKRDGDRAAVRGDAAASRRGYRLYVHGVSRRSESGIRIIVHRPIVGRIKTASVIRDADGKWYVSIVADSATESPAAKDGPAIGVDMGLTSFLTTSEGRHEENPRSFKSKLKALTKADKSLSRKHESRKGRRKSRRHRLAQRRRAFIHVRIRNKRKEFHHQVANRLIGEAGAICVEKLNIRGMLRRGKLSRSIQDAAWGNFLIVLKHKAKKAGVQLVEVDPNGTSQECPRCGGAVPKKGFKGLKIRVHHCLNPDCGYTTDRDHAAAQVILQRGTGIVSSKNGLGLGRTDVGAKAPSKSVREAGPQGTGGRICQSRGKSRELTDKSSGLHPRAEVDLCGSGRSGKRCLSRSVQQTIPGMEDSSLGDATET